ncbi:PspC domain-containing protein [Jeotgalibaca arthritidis]|jgi:phage shock protein C|uniref:PspC domain-containing protein n=1 Tax=Jeotgalibaca arthritidis TaxID=1868794 RepID=A0A6G7KAE7_9LACT|nr:PspC domain-containing protein [Jeotgalibaca arthritidis]QII82226.1 PspC domain-containing protein [Jeotgalibaca arthritidis]
MKKLTKSATDRQVSGVLGGIAEYFGIDSTIIRIIFVIFAFAGVGSPVFLYILLAILLPEPERPRSNRRPNAYGNERKEAKPIQKDEDEDWSDF